MSFITPPLRRNKSSRRRARSYTPRKQLHRSGSIYARGPNSLMLHLIDAGIHGIAVLLGFIRLRNIKLNNLV
jgi:hypothetical protein